MQNKGSNARPDAHRSSEQIFHTDFISEDEAEQSISSLQICSVSLKVSRLHLTQAGFFVPKI